MNFSVYVYHGDTISRRARPQLLHMCESADMARLLARSVREIFGCPAFIVDYWRPADLYNIKRRADRDAAAAAERMQAG